MATRVCLPPPCMCCAPSTVRSAIDPGESGGVIALSALLHVPAMITSLVQANCLLPSIHAKKLVT